MLNGPHADTLPDCARAGNRAFPDARHGSGAARKWRSRKDSSGILEYSFLEHGGKRGSLVVKIKGRREGKGTAFAGHLDTVACEADKDWIYAPLNAAVENGILYGRGAADMKGGVAAMMLTAEYLLSRGERPEEPVFFFFTADEEKDGIGARTLVEKGYMDQVGKLFICVTVKAVRKPKRHAASA